MRFLFEGIHRPIEFRNCDELTGLFARIAPSWRFEPSSRDAGDPVIVLEGRSEGYRLASDWLEEDIVEASAVSAVCSFIVDLVRAYVEDANVLCLHCGAVEISGRLVVFPSWYRAGKSTLCARLAASGHRQFADDVLPVRPDSGEALALGVSPRLRQPLPRAAGKAFRTYVDANQGPKDERYLYLALPPERHAPFGATAPIGAIVLLERDGGAKAELSAIPRPEALKRLLAQNFGHPGGAGLVFERLAAVTSRVPCLLLRYSDLDEAVEKLEREFGRAASAERPSVSGRPSRFDGALPAPKRRRPVTGAFLRVPTVSEHDMQSARFLVDSASDAIFHLNPVAAAVWELLAEPADAGEVSALLVEAYPGIEPSRIEADVRALFSDLHANGLIARARRRA